MAAEKTRRKLFKVSKELNLSHHTIIEFLEKKGYKVSGLNTPITDEMHDEILHRFAQEKVKAEKIAKRRQEHVKEVEQLQVETAEIDKAETVEAKKAKTVEEIKTADERSISEKINGMEEKPEEEIQELSEGKVEGISPELDELDIEEREEQKETTEVHVGDIIDHPIAKQFLEMEEEKKRRKKEKKKKIFEKIKEVPKTKKIKKEKPEEKIAAETSDKEEVIPKRIRALEKEEPEFEQVTLSETEVKPKKKKEKREEEFDEELTDKERRRRKAFEMIRRESRKPKFIKPELALEDEEAVEEKGDRPRRTRKKKEIDQQEVQDTLKKTLASMQEGGTGRRKRKKIKTTNGEEIEEENVITVTEFITVQDLANLMDVPVAEVIKKCLELGQMVSVNQRLDMDMIKLLAEDYKFKVIEEEEFASDYLEELMEEPDNEEDYQSRHPVVTVMGHVDHGKTSLLDYIRKTNVVAGESGGITQHIGAYVVTMDDGRSITFLDTPGHEAFTAMRSRGAQVTDIVVLVIAADDKVMPQTEEAIDHAKAAGVPIIIAVNKIDKPNADPQAIRKQLADRNILVEDWGGKYQVVNVSAKTGEGIPELLEKIQLEAELLELKANHKIRARGVVIESRLDKGKGPVATVLVQQGFLKVGNDFIIGQYYGRVRALHNERNQSVKSAEPAFPVQIQGIDGVPEAGDKLIVMPDERQGREIALRRQQLKREQDFRQIRLITLDEISRQIKEGTVKELNIIVKADVDGSAQALSDALQKVSSKDVAVKVVRRAVGPISESDVMLASASRAIIIGFHIRPTIKAKELAESESVDIRLYKVIYDAIDDIKKALEGLLEPEEREEAVGTVEVREIFKVSRLGTIAGCYVLQGKINRNSLVKLIRNDVEIYEGRLTSLKRFKDDVKEVNAGYECGLMIENFNDIKPGDIVEAYEVIKEKRTLEL
jgi:translation initiation factor IF-2